MGSELFLISVTLFHSILRLAVAAVDKGELYFRERFYLFLFNPQT